MVSDIVPYGCHSHANRASVRNATSAAIVWPTWSAAVLPLAGHATAVVGVETAAPTVGRSSLERGPDVNDSDADSSGAGNSVAGSSVRGGSDTNAVSADEQDLDTLHATQMGADSCRGVIDHGTSAADVRVGATGDVAIGKMVGGMGGDNGEVLEAKQSRQGTTKRLM